MALRRSEIEVRHAAQRESARALASPSTDEEGEFAVVVPGQGPFLVRAFAEISAGTRLEAVRQPVEAGTTGLRLGLPRTARLRGRVLDDRGAPVEEFTLLLRRTTSPQEAPLRATFRQSGGSFETEELECRLWRGTVTAAGFGPAELPFSLPQKNPLEVRLSRAARVQGVVRDELGNPAEGVRVGVLGTDLGRSEREHAGVAPARTLSGAPAWNADPGRRALRGRWADGQRWTDRPLRRGARRRQLPQPRARATGAPSVRADLRPRHASPLPRGDASLFRFAALPEGDYLLRVFTGPRMEEHRVQVQGSAPGPIRIELGRQ